MRVQTLVKGFASHIPGANNVLTYPNLPRSDEAAYSYGVWLKHVTMLHESGTKHTPEVVLELGPGNSLGVGLCALLSGASFYYALDAVPLARQTDHVAMLYMLVYFFRHRAPRPNKGWPDFDDYLDSDLFPHHILSDTLLRRSLDPGRIKSIRRSLEHLHADGHVRYIVPWRTTDIQPGSVNLVLSHSVLQAVLDLPALYTCMNLWLKPGGYMSHQIDLSSHEITKAWNGQYAIPRWQYRLAAGRRPTFLNRATASEHIALAERSGFNVVTCLRLKQKSAVRRSALMPPFTTISDEDLATAELFMQAQKDRGQPIERVSSR